MKKTISAVVAGLLLSTAALADDVVVVGNPAAAALTKDQVTDLFLGKTTGMKLVDQPDSSKIKVDFYGKLGRDLSQVKATWSRLIFTGKAQAPKEVADSAAVKKAVAADPSTIGYIDKSEVDGTVKVLSTL
jgi:ABC-type phosphate transport system substrate-binding protein